MARAYSIWLVTLNSRPLRAFSVKHELLTYLDRSWPKCPTNMAIYRMQDGHDKSVEDVTAKIYLKDLA